MLLTNRAVCDFTGQVVSAYFCPIFRWVNKCLTDQAYSKKQTDTLSSVGLRIHKEKVLNASTENQLRCRNITHK
jgi:hypothetical protein